MSGGVWFSGHEYTSPGSATALAEEFEVTTDGGVREIATMRVVNVHQLLFSGDDVIVVCAREGGNVHKSSFYVVDRAGAAPMRGPRKLPDDTTVTVVRGKAIASGGAMRRVSKTSID